MEVWALANQKGGCGKTTVAVNLAAALARGSRASDPSEGLRGGSREDPGGILHRSQDGGSRVLLIDLDPQAHATLGLGHSAGVGPSIAQVFLDDVPLASAVRKAPGGIDLCPASLALGEYEAVSERRLHPEGVLSRALESVRDRYDWVLVDCPPRADGVLASNAVRAATGVCLVVETGAFALQGALRARALLASLHADAVPQPRYRVLATMYDRRTRFARDVLIGMQTRFESQLFETAIRESVRLREAAAYGLPVQEFDPRSRAARDFDSLAREFQALVPPPSASAAAPDLRPMSSR